MRGESAPCIAAEDRAMYIRAMHIRWKDRGKPGGVGKKGVSKSQGGKEMQERGCCLEEWDIQRML